MTDSPKNIEGASIDADRRWAALEAGLADLESPDFDASLFDDGPGPWVILKGSSSDGPDPDDVFTVPASRDRVVQSLHYIQAAHATAESWSAIDSNAERFTAELRVLVYFSEESSIYESMRIGSSIAELDMSLELPIIQLTDVLMQVISDFIESRIAATVGPR